MEIPRQSIFRVLLINLAIFGTLLVALVVIVELALRHYIPSWDHSGLVRLTSTPITYEMEPNLEIVREGVEIKTNSDGFRDTSFSGEPRPGQFLIAVLGDSFVFGQGVPQSKTFPVVLEKLLNQPQNGKNFRVWNLGVSGYNTEQEYYQLESFILPRKPNWVVVGYNINDCEPIGIDPSSVKKEERGEQPFTIRWYNFFNRLLITQFLKQRVGNFIRLFDSHWYASTYVQDTLIQYLEPNNGWTKVSALLLKMKIDCDREGIGFTVAILPAMLSFSNYPFLRADDVITSFCKANGVDCVDVLQYFKGHNFMNYWVSALDPHPNARAQRIFAQAVADHLSRKIP